MWPDALTFLIKLWPVKLCVNLKKAVCHVFLQAANAHKRSLESEVKIRTAAMENFDQMNSSLISANLTLQVTNQSHQTLRRHFLFFFYSGCYKKSSLAKISSLCRNPFWTTVRREWARETMWKVCGAPMRKHNNSSETRSVSWLQYRLKTKLSGFR